jgi:SAM-dependent methyltransferase
MPSGVAQAQNDGVAAIEALPNVERSSSETWDDFVKLWLASDAQRLWRRHSDAVNRGLLSRWLPRSADRILKTDLWDEAVSDGLFPALATHTRQVVGIDVSAAVVNAAVGRYPALHARCADVRRLPFTDGAFDVVVSNSTLDHFATIDDIQIALAELHRVMRPGGTLVVTLDNPSNPIIALRRALPRSAFDAVWQNFGELAARIAPSALGATCNVETLARLVTTAGFDVGERTSLVHCPRVLAVLVADQLARRSSQRAQERFLSFLLRFEKLASLPTRFWTGHFVAIRATR